MSDPALPENEADDGQGPTSPEQAKEWGRDLATLRDHAKRRKKAHRAAGIAAPVLADITQAMVDAAVQRAAERAAQRAAEAFAAPATELGTAVTTVATGLAQSLANTAAPAAPANNASIATRDDVDGDDDLGYQLSDPDDDIAR
jgi:hypothetical protein